MALKSSGVTSSLTIGVCRVTCHCQKGLGQFGVFMHLGSSSSTRLLGRISRCCAGGDGQSSGKDRALIPFNACEALFGTRVFSARVMSGSTSRFSSRCCRVCRRVGRGLSRRATPTPAYLTGSIGGRAGDRRSISGIERVDAGLLLTKIVIFSSGGRPLYSISEVRGLELVSRQIKLRCLGTPMNDPRFALVRGLDLYRRLH